MWHNKITNVGKKGASMDKTVIFIRHTEAQTIAEESDDKLRKLTEKGKIDAKKIARSIRPILKKDSITILSSSLIRAMETANLIAKKLDSVAIETDWIAGGSMGKLQDAILACTTEVLIIVGHEPTLSQWIESFTHAKLPMKKGTACALKFGEDVAEGADLLWYIDKNALPWNE